MAEPRIPALAETRVVPLARIRRERMLPARGQVDATIGNRVGALDIVARTNAAGHLRPIPLARYLRLTEAALPKHLVKKVGDSVQAREVIASKPEVFGTIQRIYRAPADGRIAAIQGTWLTIDLADTPFELRALYRGTISNIMPRLGVVIEATGALVQGVWGAGGEGYGVLRQMVDEADNILTADKIDVTVRGVVLLAGAGVTEEALQRAAQERAAGLIVGSLSPRLCEVIAALAFPTLITEGFGERPMSKVIFDVLAAHANEETALVTTTRARGGAVRPEAFIPAMTTSAASAAAAPPPTLMTELGAAVRVIAAPHLGAIGKIAEVPLTPQMLESGAAAWGAEIELSAGHRVFVPWENLELIG